MIKTINVPDRSSAHMQEIVEGATKDLSYKDIAIRARDYCRSICTNAINSLPFVGALEEVELVDLVVDFLEAPAPDGYESLDSKEWRKLLLAQNKDRIITAVLAGCVAELLDLISDSEDGKIDTQTTKVVMFIWNLLLNRQIESLNETLLDPNAAKQVTVGNKEGVVGTVEEKCACSDGFCNCRCREE